MVISSISNSLVVIEHRLSYNKKDRRMKQGKTRGAKPPVNINISFNINPKHIMHPQVSSQSKYQQHFLNQPPQIPQNLKTSTQLPSRQQHHYHNSTLSDHYKGNSKQNESNEMGKKQLNLLKKSLFSKINNIDISLPSPSTQLHPQRDQAKDDNSSIMSAKLQQFPQHNLDLLEPPHSHHLHLDLSHFQQGKSKMLINHEPSKILGTQTLRKHKDANKKHSLSQTRQPSKWSSRDKDYPCLTERRMKEKPRKETKMKRRVEKQQSLKDKLERFKLDMMKLVSFYQENEVLKTKMSSEYYNIRSRQISKDNVMQFTDGEQHQKMAQMRRFQDKGNVNKVDQSVPVSVQLGQKSKEQLLNFKQIYQGLKKSELQQGSQECTIDIINYYKQLHSQKDSNEQLNEPQVEEPEKKVQASKSSEEERKSHQSSEHFAQNEINVLVHFISFMQKQYIQDNKTEFNQTINQFFKEFLQEKHLFKPVEQSVSKEQPNDGADFIEEMDRQINKQIQQIPRLSKDLSESIETMEMTELRKWQKNCAEQLLTMKAKMWREYRSIRNQIQSRITSGGDYCQIDTQMSKKKSRIMKCLSQKMLKNHPICSTFLEEKPSIKHQQQQEFIYQERMEDVSFDSSTSYHTFQETHHPNNEHLDVQMSEQEDLSEDKFTNGRVVFNQPHQLNTQILVEDRNQPQEPISIQTVTLDDKEDIFQFIFLDLCIELYQDTIDVQRSDQHHAQTTAADRILHSIKKYISEEKKRKIIKQYKKIGISTNINTVRAILKEMITYFTQQSQLQPEIRPKLIGKLNCPLGPTDSQMLKSLRIPVLEEQQLNQMPQTDFEDGDLLILQPDWFLLFENDVVHVQELQFPKYYDSEDRDQQRINFLRNCTHIHHKAIFDCLNENLDYYRAFGLWGKPFVWKNKASFEHQLRQDFLQPILNKAASEVLRSTTFACGLMVNKEQSLIKDIAGDEQYVRRLQDERIFKYLENFVIELEEKWFFHDDQEAEVLIEVSHIVWTLILKEALKDIFRVLSH